MHMKGPLGLFVYSICVEIWQNEATARRGKQTLPRQHAEENGYVAEAEKWHTSQQGTVSR